MDYCNYQDSLWLKPIYQPIAVDKSLSYVFATYLGNDTIYQGKFAGVPRGRQHCCDNGPSIMLRIPSYIFSDGFKVLRRFR